MAISTSSASGIFRFHTFRGNGEREKFRAVGVLLVSSDALERQVGWYYDNVKKRLFVKLHGDNRSEVEVVVR